MTFANAGSMDALPGRRDDLVRLLTRRSDRVAELGCSLYEVGVSGGAPDTVFVLELWSTAEAHHASLQDPQVRAAIEEARPLLAGRFGGFRFDVVGSPLHDRLRSRFVPPPCGGGEMKRERSEGGQAV